MSVPFGNFATVEHRRQQARRVRDPEMSRDALDKIVNTVLYEGYILYPYRASSKKNQAGRFTFGRVYPADYAAAQGGREPGAMQTEFLVRNESKDAIAKITIRFLQPLARRVARLEEPAAELTPEVEAKAQLVAQFEVGDKLYQTWQEATERGIALPPLTLNAAAKTQFPFEFAESRQVEPIRQDGHGVIGLVVRQQAAIKGLIEVEVEMVEPDAARIRVRILNQTAAPDELLENQEAIALRTFASTHIILHAAGGECISLLDPPGHYLDAAQACRQIGAWPVLVGDEKKGERDLMLSSPIILYDYPKIAPESAGDLFDGAEIDEILTLRIQTLTEAEKAEMRQIDEHARRILERTENLAPGDLLRMHGAMREVQPQPGEEFFNPARPLQEVTVGGVKLKAGDRVRIRPKRRADVMDIALDGRVAIIESVQQDVEGEAHFALILEEDPGRDLGLMRQPGHRFFYGADEVEPLADR
jgi:hydrogenase maturation protease